MKIHNFSRIIGFPFAICFAVILYLSIQNRDYALSYWMIPPFVILAGIFIMGPQIDFWWSKRNPPGVDPPIKDWLLKYSPFYQSLDQVDRTKFEERLSIYLLGKEFFAMGAQKEGVPEDLKAVVGHNAIILTFNHEDFMFDNFDRIVLYKHPFPSPQFQFLHTVETEKEDGVMLFSLDYLVQGAVNPSQYYNTAMHGYADAYMKNNPSIDWDSLSNVTWDDVTTICRFTKEQILGVLGFKTIDEIPMVINLFFTYPAKFKERLPKEYQFLKDLFGTWAYV